MAGLALRLRAKMTLMVIFVAGLAGHRKLECRWAWRAVALFANKAAVCAGEREAGLTGVIESPSLPIERVVAGSALRRGAQSSLVCGVLMATLALHGHAAESLRDVTALA